MAELNATALGVAPCAGALVRYDGGYGCIHPWPSLGDADIEEQLAQLARDEPSALGLRALECCAIDGAARRERRNLFAGLEVPRSHVTAPAGEQADVLMNRASGFGVEGFDIVKMKVGADVAQEAARVNTFAALWRQVHAENRIRLDFNGTLDPEDFRGFAGMLSPEAIGMIDFVEDPCPYDPIVWRSLQRDTGLTFALDHGAEHHCSDEGFSVRVWKPACSPQPEPFDGERLVVTSYMDHAVGQVFAAYEAARCPGPVDTCGLLTHPLFADDPFFAMLSVKNTRLVSPEGPGIGFGAMLEALPWKPLT